MGSALAEPIRGDYTSEAKWLSCLKKGDNLANKLQRTKLVVHSASNFLQTLCGKLQILEGGWGYPPPRLTAVPGPNWAAPDDYASGRELPCKTAPGFWRLKCEGWSAGRKERT